MINRFKVDLNFLFLRFLLQMLLHIVLTNTNAKVWKPRW